MSCATWNACKEYVDEKFGSGIDTDDPDQFDAANHRCYCWDGGCCIHHGYPAAMDRAGETYGLPLGWCAFGLPIDPAAARRNNIFASYHRCFHGMNSSNATKFLNDPMRQLLMRGDTTPGGVKLPCDRGSGDSDFYNHIFTSKSIKYCAYSDEAPHNLGGYYCIKERFCGHDFLVAFQVLQKPDSYTVNCETVGATRAGVNPIDESFPNSELEWKTKSRGVHFLQRLLVKCVGQAAEPSRGSTASRRRWTAAAQTCDAEEKRNAPRLEVGNGYGALADSEDSEAEALMTSFAEAWQEATVKDRVWWQEATVKDLLVLLVVVGIVVIIFLEFSESSA